MNHIITAKNIILRNFKESDLPDFYEYCSQIGVGELAGWPHHESLNQSAKVLNEFIENENQYAIVLKSNHKVIGHIGIHEDSEDRKPDTKELGYVLNRNYWNHGIMTEAIIAVLKNLFSEGIRSVYACCFQNNLASKHLIEKCGFAFEQEGTYYAKQLEQTFRTFEYVYTEERWNSAVP